MKGTSVSTGVATATGVLPGCTIHVCTSCRPPGTPRDPRESRPGHILYEALREGFRASPLRHQVEVIPAECLSICPRPCGIALSRPGAWTYLFGDQQTDKTMDDVLECVSLYLESADGFIARDDRPKTFRRSILGRIPPPKQEPTCI